MRALVATWAVLIAAILVAAYREAREADRREALGLNEQHVSLREYAARAIPDMRNGRRRGDGVADRSQPTENNV